MRRIILPYNKSLVPLAKKLRRNMTTAEIILWSKINRGQMMGFDFDRQRPILEYIVDFYCKDLMLVIEIDGNSHDENKYDYDVKRQKEIEALGVSFLRFRDDQVKKELDMVLYTIAGWIEKAPNHK